MHYFRTVTRWVVVALHPCLLCLGAAPVLAAELPAGPPPEQATPAPQPAALPEEELATGKVRGAGGHYGAVRALVDDPALQAAANRWLRSLRPGEPIREGALQRRLLLIKALPGVSSKSVLSADEEGGERELTVTLQRGPRYSGLVGLDNHGSRFTGNERVRAGLELESLWTLGDSLSLQGNRRWHGTWVANLGYTLPLGTNGWSGHVELEHSYYQLHRERKGLGAKGASDILLLELSYPLWLADDASLRVSVGWELTHSDDETHPYRGQPSAEHRKLQMVPLTLNVQRADAKGSTRADLTLGLGRLRLDDALSAEDRSSDRTEGRYRLFNADLRREQKLRKGWTLFGRFFGQKSSRNLDSEKWFAAGGPQKIRAWTGGDAQGDEGWLLQTELRHRMGSAEPFVFIDSGQVKLRHRPWRKSQAGNWRSLSGLGLGLRWTEKSWQAQAVLAWRTGGHRPVSRLGYRNPRLWLSAIYRF